MPFNVTRHVYTPSDKLFRNEPTSNTVFEEFPSSSRTVPDESSQSFGITRNRIEMTLIKFMIERNCRSNFTCSGPIKLSHLGGEAKVAEGKQEKVGSREV